MRNNVAVLAGLGLMAAIAAKPAEALMPPMACSPGALSVCAAVSATSYNVGGQWKVKLNVWNLFGYNGPSTGVSSAITWVGLGSSSWSGIGALASAVFNGAAAGWVTANSIPGNPVGAQIDYAASGTNGINHGLIGCSQPGSSGQYQTCYPTLASSLELVFNTSSQFVVDDNASYGWHAQAVNGTGCSLWVDSNGNTTADNTGACANVVPEPVTMLLLGTGLAGMGGVGLVRRRRKNGDIENA